jgi:aspartyl protease family protein
MVAAAPADPATVNTSLILFAKIANFARHGRSMFFRRRGDIGKSTDPGPLIECGVMRNIMIFAAMMIGLGTVMAQIADKMTPTSAAATTAARKAVPGETVPQAGSRSLSIPRDARGHFAAEGRIEGQRIAFMVDTGASVIALNESSAARFGLRPARGDYKATVTTANGTIKAAPTRLAMVDIGGLVVRDVDAMVLPDEALSENLLGLSFLSKLKRFEYANGKMVLEQ